MSLNEKNHPPAPQNAGMGRVGGADEEHGARGLRRAPSPPDNGTSPWRNDGAWELAERETPTPSLVFAIPKGGDTIKGGWGGRGLRPRN